MKAIRVYWDENAKDEGWFAEVQENGNIVSDSLKIWFPVDLDQYGRDQTDEMRTALQDAFPHHQIDIH